MRLTSMGLKSAGHSEIFVESCRWVRTIELRTLSLVKQITQLCFIHILQIIVCRYKKIKKYGRAWTFELCDGISMIKGQELAFTEAAGKAEW